MRQALWTALACGMLAATARGDETSLFNERIAPIFERRCLSCHNDELLKGEFSLETAEAALESGHILPGDVELSHLVEMITPAGGKAAMPKNADPLSAAEVEAIKTWIAAGAKWPAGRKLTEARVTNTQWWSLLPLEQPALPVLAAEDQKWVRTPIDVFILAKLRERKLAPSPAADRRTLIRRVTYDLTGLPPTPEEIAAFVADADPQAYEKLVDRLLASPAYGERWARHWLDVVHYGDTHGYDKDKLRPNAWPYRDYVIRALNDDKPYTQFVREQLAGDKLFPSSPDGVVATGFIVAGPFDWVGQVEVGEGTPDKQIVRNLDRDDMVATAMNTFVSTTVQCARCHNHKFDPITQEDYYSLQAVFAAVDRADRRYDSDPVLAAKRAKLSERAAQAQARYDSARNAFDKRIGPELAKFDARIANLEKAAAPVAAAEFGYHSAIEGAADTVKWVQLDLGQSLAMERVEVIGAWDDFNQIGAGFGFPVRWKVEISDDPQFAKGVSTLVDHTAADFSNPGIVPQVAPAGGRAARYVRVTATKLATRLLDYNFALAEIRVLTPDGANVATGAELSALDEVHVPPRWQLKNLNDGVYRGADAREAQEAAGRLRGERGKLLAAIATTDQQQQLTASEREFAAARAQLAALPPQGVVFAAATDFSAVGNFRPTRGKPRPIHVLHRGDERSPRQEVGPGTISAVQALPHRFPLSADADEADRRVALAEWVVDRRNPLTWRSIVNRVWSYHFGRGLVDTPNDFGRMGEKPSHEELLNWLAADFRDHGQSLKKLHRLILTSAVYRQSSADHPEYSKIDGGNVNLWRMNRARLEAEALHDTVLALCGKLDPTMSGPGYFAFGFKDDHSPHYNYHEHDPDDPKSHRRAIYRFIVRSVPDPFMEALDCADPSQVVAKRNETLTALQALALMNNKFMVRMAEHFAARLECLGGDLPEQLNAGCRLALGRNAEPEELAALVSYAQQHGLPNACRLLFNSNEFLFVD